MVEIMKQTIYNVYHLFELDLFIHFSRNFIDFLSTKHKKALNVGHAKQTFIQIMDINCKVYSTV